MAIVPGETSMRTAPRLRSVALILGVLATLIIGQVSTPARGGGLGGNSNATKVETPPEPVRTIHLSSPVTAQAAKTWLKLQEPISVSFVNETPLEDFLKFLKDATRGKDRKEPGIRFFVEPGGLQEAEKTMTSPIVIDLEEVPLSTVLELTLHQLGLRYYVQKDGIVMITAENTDDPGTMGDPTALLLDSLSTLQAEVAALRHEVAKLRPGR
jgi:hypothetical protein